MRSSSLSAFLISVRYWCGSVRCFRDGYRPLLIRSATATPPRQSGLHHRRKCDGCTGKGLKARTIGLVQTERADALSPIEIGERPWCGG